MSFRSILKVRLKNEAPSSNTSSTARPPRQGEAYSESCATAPATLFFGVQELEDVLGTSLKLLCFVSFLLQ